MPENCESTKRDPKPSGSNPYVALDHFPLPPARLKTCPDTNRKPSRAATHLPSSPRNKCHASMYCANLCPSYGVKFNDLFRAATANGMMYHKSIGTRYTANTSSFPRTYRTPVLLMMLHVYDPFLSK